MPRDIEIILLEQLGGCLAIPIFVVDPQGDLLFYNESAEPLVGQRFEEAGALSLSEWSDRLRTSDKSGRAMDQDERLMVTSLRKREPVHRNFFLRGMDGERRELFGTAIPLIGEEARLLGALGLFWEPNGSELGTHNPLADRKSGQQQHVELILMRRLACHLSTPIYLIGADGVPLYLNKAGERLIDRTLEEIQAYSEEELFESFRATGTDGTSLKPEEHPMEIARVQNVPTHSRFYNHDQDGTPRLIEGSAFPLIGQTGHNLGVAGIFWEIDES